MWSVCAGANVRLNLRKAVKGGSEESRKANIRVRRVRESTAQVLKEKENQCQRKITIEMN
jgi:hypothetical protein